MHVNNRVTVPSRMDSSSRSAGSDVPTSSASCASILSPAMSGLRCRRPSFQLAQPENGIHSRDCVVRGGLINNVTRNDYVHAYIRIEPRR